jgi:long-chain acyl-CoA synthetase
MNSKPWLAHYDSVVPATLEPYPDKTLLDCAAETARERPGHPFLWFKGRQLSYLDVERLSDAVAAALVSHRIARGDRVALLLPNCPQGVISQLAVWKAGAIAVPLNPLYSETELTHAFRESGAVAAIVLTAFYRKLKAIQAKTGVRLVVATKIKEFLPPLTRVLFTLAREKRLGHRVAIDSGDLWWSDLVRAHAGSAAPRDLARPADDALLLFTGGTTGAARAAVSTHKGLVATGLQIQAWSTEMLPAWNSVMMLLMPLFHTYGNCGVLATALAAHWSLIVVPNPRDLDDVVATIRRTRPNAIPGVPTFFIALLEHPRVKAGKVDLRSVRVCISGAAPLMAETKRRFEEETGGKLLEGYALTESVMAAVVNPCMGPNKQGSVGLPLPDVEVRIVDAESGRDTMAPGAVGEVIIRAPQIMRGYWGSPVESESMVREGWLFTGDLGYLDEDGYLFLVDRKKDLIKVSGFQVWPREVEETIASHPAVNEVAVAGLPDSSQGEAVGAWIVLKPGAVVTAEAIRTFCRERLVAYKIPRHIEFRDGLPKSIVGKALRRVLREEARIAASGAPPT